MLFEILFIIFMVLWLITFAPTPQLAPYTWANGLLAWLSVLMLGLTLYFHSGPALMR